MFCRCCFISTSCCLHIDIYVLFIYIKPYFALMSLHHMTWWKHSRAHSNLVVEWNVTFCFHFCYNSYLEHTVHRRPCNKEKYAILYWLVQIVGTKNIWRVLRKWKNWFFLNSFSNHKLIKMILSILNLLQDLNGVVVAAFLCWITLKHFRGKTQKYFFISFCCHLTKSIKLKVLIEYISLSCIHRHFVIKV